MGGAFREIRPQGPAVPAASNTMQFHANTLSLSGNAIVQLSTSAEEVSACNARLRPRNAEPEVRGPAVAPPVPPALVTPLDRYRSRIGLTSIRSGRDSLSCANVSMPLHSFVEMVADPECQSACKSMHAFLGGGQSEIPVQEVRVSQDVRAHQPSFAEVVTNPVAAPAKSPITASVISTGMLAPLHANAVQAKGGTILEIYSVSMPAVEGTIDAGRLGAVKRPMYFDIGASVSCISQEAYNKDAAVLKAAGGVLVKLEPLKLGMYNRQHSVVTEILAGVSFRIGQGVYTTSFLVVPQADYEYLLGAEFMARFDVKPSFHTNSTALGCPKGIANRPVPRIQHVPLYYKGGAMKLAVKGPRVYSP